MPVLYEPHGRAFEYSKLALNIYRCCSHGCRYCFAPDTLFITRDSFSNVHYRDNLLARLKIDLVNRGSKAPRERVLLCFTCDPYPTDIDTTVTREVIQLLHEYGYPVQILTKGGLRACRDFDLLKRGDAFATTLTLFNKEDSLQMEPGAAIPMERLYVLQQAHARNIETWASMEPVIDPDQTLKLIQWAAPYVDLFKVGKLNSQKTMPADLKQLAKTIDWRKFANDVVNLLESLHKAYYIKNDLVVYLNEHAV